MSINRKGFTLIEMLAVIVILAMIMVIAIPNILSIVEDSKNNSFSSAAKIMLGRCKQEVQDNSSIDLPLTNNHAIIVKLSSLNTENFSKDIDGGIYNLDNSYVLIVNYSDNTSEQYVYYATLAGSKREINLAKEGTIDGNDVIPNGTVTAPKTTYSSAELGETGSFTVTVDSTF